MLRSLFIALSQSEHFRRWLSAFPLSRRFARRFVAGETLAEAVAVIQRLNRRGLLATFNLLGESVTNAAESAAAADDFIRILDGITHHRLRSNVSLKLTQLGLDIDAAICLQNMRRILTHAQRDNIFVRIDMEGSAHTQRTLEVYFKLRDDGFENVGVVIQSYLRRSADDVKSLADGGANIRLVKGAYAEPPTIAFPQKSEVDKNFLVLAELMWDAPALAKSAYAALATHDEHIIRWAMAETARRGITKDRFEFQMLYGVRAQRQAQLAADGYRVRVYVPYGTQWYPYFMRRLAERPANVIFLLRNLFER